MRIFYYIGNTPGFYWASEQRFSKNGGDSDVFTVKQIKELQKHNDQLEEENFTLKNDCYIYATLKQRLDAVCKLCFQHNIRTLC